MNDLIFLKSIAFKAARVETDVVDEDAADPARVASDTI